MTFLVSAPLAFATAGQAEAAPRSASSVPATAAASSAQRTTLRLINAERARHGLRRLRLSGSLTRSARSYSRQMVRGNFFGHVAPSGSTPTSRIRKGGYMRGTRSWRIGENLAWGVGSSSTPRATMSNWMNSAGHRANILNPSFREIGIGIAKGAPGYPGGVTYTTHFGARR